MVNKQKTLPLIGLVIAIPAGAGLASSSTETRRSSAALAIESSRRAFLAATSSVVLGTAFARPADAATRSFPAPMNFGYIKRKGEWQRIGGGDKDSDSSDDSSGTSDDESVSSSDSEEEKKKSKV